MQHVAARLSRLAWIPGLFLVTMMMYDVLSLSTHLPHLPCANVSQDPVILLTRNRHLQAKTNGKNTTESY